ncbi:protein root UVB sensitive 5 isoform X2 [Cornus florida]|uniref:protein root UVB sensitive 5 isoform X2 n=1 Tax=Cornus florida TaxID=4283 RepID=UPI002897D48E|nr:protein root UVB sensitive 5 isoform X2 [Cornus florida]
MSYALQLPAPTFVVEYSTKLRRTRARNLQTLCSSSSSSAEQSNSGEGEPEEDSENRRGEGQQHVILVERYGNGTSKRYILDDKLQLRTSLKEHGSETNGFQGSHISDIPDIIKDFILPAGFPGSVSDDYLEYMLLQFPTNVTGWICHTLVTTSLLKAVGVGSFSGTTAAASAAASAAAIRWVSKDGIGAVGRFIIGGRFGNIFDDDPKQWRMYADFIGSAGSIFDLCTPLYPSYFLPLASLGNLTKAVARGLKDPSFRVIQNHFAISGNLGEVAAKEEVWEVAAQLLGLALGVLILATPGIVASYPLLALTWMTMRLGHLWLRYQSLSVLQFNTINLTRARMLVKSHVLNSTVPGCLDCNRMENILSWQKFLVPRIIFGVSLEEIFSRERSISMVKGLLRLYAKEKYVLVVNQQQKMDFEVGATSVSVLRSVWQTYWLHHNWLSNADAFDQLQKSLMELEDGFQNFMQLLEGAGWDTDQINLKVPRELSIEEIGTV